jgi:hypothetical protein
MRRLTTLEKLNREEFVLSRVSQGFSRREIHGTIKAQFNVSDRAANNIYNAAVDNAPKSTPKETRFNRQVILTAYSGQIRSAHSDMTALQTLIDEANDQNKKRKELIAEFINNGDSHRREEITNELKANPLIKITNISSIIAQKNKVRAQLGSSISDLARIFGLFADMPLLQAINVIAAAELLPPEVANKMLEAIEDISSSIEQSMTKQDSEANSEPKNDDFDDLEPEDDF